MPRPVFCGNFEYDTRQSDLERLFSKYGAIRRIDMKSGYAFIYFEDERDGEEAIKRLDNVEFGHDRRRLSVEWSRQVEPVAKNRDRPTGDVKPTRTLFVINFDPLRTKTEDIERHFEPYGKITNIRIRKNFAFVQYETQEEASAAVKETDKSKIMDRVVTVEYAFRDDDNGRDDRIGSPRRGDRGRRYDDNERDDRYGNHRQADRGRRYDGNERDDRYGYGSPRRTDQGRYHGGSYMRSPSPRYRRDYSPDYDRRGRNHGYDRRDGALYDYDKTRSPGYGRYGRNRSPGYARY